MCLLDGGRQVGAVRLEPVGAHWFLLVHGSWRFLGTELSSLIEAAVGRGDTSLVLPGYLKVDLKMMTATSPLYAPLKRVQLPALTSSIKKRGAVNSCKLASTRLRLETASGPAVSLLRPYLCVRTSSEDPRNTLDQVELSIGGINLRVENLQQVSAISRLVPDGGTSKESFSIRKLQVNSMEFNVLGVDKRLPQVVKDSFRDYEHFRCV